MIISPGQLINNTAGRRWLFGEIRVRPGRVAFVPGGNRVRSSGPYLVIATISNPTSTSYFNYVMSADALGWYFIHDTMSRVYEPIDETPDDVSLGDP